MTESADFSSIPAPEVLEELQATIEAHLTAGAPDIAAAELEELRAPDQADAVAELSEPVQQALLGALPAETITGARLRCAGRNRARSSGFAGRI